MEAKQAQFLALLKSAQQFEIPIYQRTYSWAESECQQLWDDILRAGRDPRVASHFIGSVVYIQEKINITHPLFLVIDGQQRLTTITLLLEALARSLDDREPLAGLSAKKLRHYYLLNTEESGEAAFKLLLTQNDRPTLLALLQQAPLPEHASQRITANFHYLSSLIQHPATDLAALWQGLQKLVVVDIALEHGKDNPQLIFESLNSLGRELSQADLIRNFVLMDLSSKQQFKIYTKYWRPMELGFGSEAYGTHFDSFMRHYLTIKTGSIPRIDTIYDEFKRYVHRIDVSDGGIESVIAEMHDYVRYYCVMALARDGNDRVAPELIRAFRDLRELKVDVAYPFLLEVFHDYRQDLLTTGEFVEVVQLVEAYVFRRTVCAIPTNSHNKTFAALARPLRKDRYVESLKAQFLLMPSYRRFPGDEEFQRELTTRNIYSFPRRNHLLRKLENHDRKELVPVENLTIEHILPQNPDLIHEWRTDLGPDWQQMQERVLHTLGNLTLTGYNAEYSDRSFRDKRTMKGGFDESPLWLNEGLRHLDTWNEAAIQLRAERLAQRAVSIWAMPELPAAVLDQYRPKPTPGGYTYADHAHLMPGSKTRALYDELRVNILALDSGVTEEVLKYYLAFKAEGNVVCVVPKAAQLQLFINLPFHELHDARGLATDVSGTGHWGTGDVEVSLQHNSEIQYVVGLIRQALDRQLGNEVN